MSGVENPVDGLGQRAQALLNVLAVPGQFVAVSQGFEVGVTDHGPNVAVQLRPIGIEE